MLPVLFHDFGSATVAANGLRGTGQKQPESNRQVQPLPLPYLAGTGALKWQQQIEGLYCHLRRQDQFADVERRHRNKLPEEVGRQSHL